MVIRDRTQGEQSILDASEAILELMRTAEKAEYNPTDLVRDVAMTHDRYSARRAALPAGEGRSCALEQLERQTCSGAFIDLTTFWQGRQRARSIPYSPLKLAT